MNIVEIVEYMYPGQIALRNVTFRKPEDDILIETWNVPDVPQPTEQDLLDYGSAHERAIEIYTLAINCSPEIQKLLDATAQSKQFYDTLSCVSYTTSINATWKAQAQCFSDWRDAVWNYAFNLYDTLSGNSDPLPTVEDVINGCPQIEWPA